MRFWSEKINGFYKSNKIKLKQNDVMSKKFDGSSANKENKVEFNDNENKLKTVQNVIESDFENLEEFVIKSFEISGIKSFLNLFDENSDQVKLDFNFFHFFRYENYFL